MKRSLIIAVLFSMLCVPAFAQDAKPEKKEAVKSHLQQHFKFYGFVRNFFAYDSRESWSGTGDLYNYQPKDQKLNEYGDDLNAESTFRFLSLTTRLGLNIVDYRWRDMQ
ncbi:MAG: hypothetical protein J5688_02410, partial [Paludibacteraceae bacterium]|nr:hypothetical protein [Paludibacteraceae bacterium]